MNFTKEELLRLQRAMIGMMGVLATIDNPEEYNKSSELKNKIDSFIRVESWEEKE